MSSKISEPQGENAVGLVSANRITEVTNAHIPPMDTSNQRPLKTPKVVASWACHNETKSTTITYF